MVKAIYSDQEPPVEIETVADLDQFVEEAELRSTIPIAISLDVHGYRADFLVGHAQSFIHLTPDEYGQTNHVTVGGPTEGTVEFWLQGSHHTEFEARHLVDKASARAAFREFFQSGRLSTTVQWEQYYA
jgi:Immunity protein Imm1